MSSEQFQSAHDSIYNLGKRLSQYLQEIRQARSSVKDDAKGLQSVEDDINRALTALKEQKYQVAVIAAMKAGKSTFLNAIIGADVLASETAACTICRTDVRHILNVKDARLLEYREGQKRPFEIAKGDAGEIQQKFLVRTREIREKGNPDNTVRFEIEHPIEAISSLSSISGFTLVDTPGPNEWESANFNTVALKQTALEALRTCNVILFVLNYASYKDNAVSDLFKDIVENRKEILAENTGKIFFILNKVDQKTEGDREIDEVIKDLKRELSNFGFPNPIIYPASSRQGLLAKLIAQEKATKSQIKDFDVFFSPRYAVNRIIPLPHEVAPQALADSGIPRIQETVIQTITQNSGWNLLSDALAILDKAANAIEDNLNTQISGWEIGIEALKQKVNEYKKHSKSAVNKVEIVKKSVEEQKQILIEVFSEGISTFVNGAKAQIEREIDIIANSSSYSNTSSKTNYDKQFINPFIEPPSKELKLGFSLPSWIPFLGGASLNFETKNPLLEDLKRSILNPFTNDDEEYKSFDSYKIRVRTKTEAQKIEQTINDYCNPHIKRWWLDTEDALVRNGQTIREQLVYKIQGDIQEISNEISSYLGETLQVKLNINPIQFPSFVFAGIDTKIKEQQQVYKVKEKQTKQKEGEKQGFCEDDGKYRERTKEEVEVEVDKYRPYYEINLRETLKDINLKIDNKALASIEFLKRVVEKQIYDDFEIAEQQINDYIQRFQYEFDHLLKEREVKEAEIGTIREKLNIQKQSLNQYLVELKNIRESLDNWKPLKVIKW